ncbi:MAG: OBG GTPase family GTP-binding protein [Candidatus Aenigmatarchaeota archaeon]
MAIDDEIEETKRKLKETPVNKGTETARARLKSKIARLKEKKEKKQKESGGGKDGYAVKKRGDASVALVGPPSVGKSTLLNKLTNADSEVANYEFTTLNVVPGMMKYKGANIQILDVPGLIGGAAKGKGGGKEVLSVIRSCDMVVMMVDNKKMDGLKRMESELYDSGIRLNKNEPNMRIKKTGSGGININSTFELSLDKDTIRDVLRDNGFLNCHVVIRENLSIDELIDGIMKNRVYIPSLSVLNKIDQLYHGNMKDFEEKNVVAISAFEGKNLEKLKESIWKKLRLMRIYMKKINKEPDKEEPLIVKKNSSIREVKDELPGNFQKELKYARIWGKSSKFPGQKVGEDHILKDEDVVELHFI